MPRPEASRMRFGACFATARCADLLSESFETGSQKPAGSYLPIRARTTAGCAAM